MDREAVQLRLGGATLAQIGAHLGYADHIGARKAIIRAMSQVTLEPATELKKLEDARLEALLASLWPTAMKLGPRQLKAAGECRSIVDRRCKLHGLDAPPKIRREIVTVEDLERALDELNESRTSMEAGEQVPE